MSKNLINNLEEFEDDYINIEKIKHKKSKNKELDKEKSKSSKVKNHVLIED